MALHRDIYWVGRQWAVTGYGIQACDQKQKGKFDIEASRLWEDGVLECLRAEMWLNVEDFDKALDVARKHYPVPPWKAASPPESVLSLIEEVLKGTGSKQKSLKEVPVERPKPAIQEFDMRVAGGSAKFVPLWRIRARR
jgi:hypothetical protein